MFNTKPNWVILALIFYLSLPIARAATEEPSTKPILRIETGMHTAPITRIGVDAAERFLLTASIDKTLRLWNLHTSSLLKTYRVPLGAGDEGKLYSGAISPDGHWVAGSGWTTPNGLNDEIYLFNRASGQLVKRLSGLDNVVFHLCFSPDGQYLGATLGSGGIRVWNTQTWQQIFSDTDYANRSHWCDFDSQNRLVTSAYEGYLRLYTPASGGFSLVAKSHDTLGGEQPFAAVFSPTGDKIAVGFFDSTNVNVLDGHSLALLYAPDTTGIDNGNLGIVAWSLDGDRLYAGGQYKDGSGMNPVLSWPQAGRGNDTKWLTATNTIMDLRPLKNGRIVYATDDPAFVVLDHAGQRVIKQETSIADYRHNWAEFLISHDGHTVQFAFEQSGKRPARFSLLEQRLILTPQPDVNLTQPDTTRLNITGWQSTPNPTLNGNALPLEPYEPSVSLAIAPDKSAFLLGTEWHLYLFDTSGQPIWKVAAPSVAWGVNISGDGQKAVAAFGDGTIRWYNLTNGEELLTLFPHEDGQRWIAWTKSGYYLGSADNADNLMGWHVNNGKDKEASFYPAGALYATYKRPDIVQKILTTLNEAEAIRLANLEQEEPVEPPVNVGEALAEVKDKYQVNLAPSGLGKAIIIAAGGEQDSNTLFTYTNYFTTAMYRLLHQVGFSDGDIIYLNPYPPVVPFNGYVDAGRQDFPLRDPKLELQQAIAQASQDLKAGQQFILYLHGHAQADYVRLNFTSAVYADEIKALLDQIPPEVAQIIILDTCYSGSFLDELAEVPNRVVITSTDADTLAWSVAKAGSFSYTLIRELRRGESLFDAFVYAEGQIIHDPKTFGGQKPQLDDTQDGFYASNDGRLARKTYLGGQKVPASTPPEIKEIHPPLQLAAGQSSATLWVKAVPDFNGMKQVRAILVNEHDQVTEYQGESTQYARRELILKPNYDLQRYEIDYDQFQTANHWTILYQAQNMEGDWSEIRAGSVVSEAVDTQVKTHLNKTTYTEGDHMQFDVTLSGDALVDFYVGVIFPQGHYKTISNSVGFSPDNVLLPYQTGVQLTSGQTFQILRLDLPAIAVGDYQACGLVTRAGSDAYNEANWLHLDCKGLHFQ